MTSDDWTAPLKSKRLGTMHLDQTFRTCELDFFVLLSSATSLIGTRGSANYAAGNVFQDAFAFKCPQSSCRYVSTNIGGVIEGATVNIPAQEQNLHDHGLLTTSPEELQSFLEFALGLSDDAEDCRRIAMGFDSQSISEASVSNLTSRSLMFSHVWKTAEREKTSTQTMERETFRDLLTQHADSDTLHHWIAYSIGNKVCDYVALDREKVDLNILLRTLGMDSLITIELKNWIAKEFEAAVQPSEILDHESIVALASTIRARSGLGRDSHDVGKEPGVILDDGLALQQAHDEQSFTLNIKLPSLPLPSLEDSFGQYVDSRRCFLSPEELERTLSAIEDFQRLDGLGRKLQIRLKARQEDLGIDNWQWDLYAQDIYLSRRDPIHPYITFYGGYIVSEKIHSQVERAVIISVAAFAFKAKIESGTLEQNMLNEEPLCMATLPWLFNSCREPHPGVDQMRHYSNHDYAVVLRRGQVFRVELKDEGAKPVSVESLASIFQLILDQSDVHRPAVASLTSDERDSWAKVGKPRMKETPLLRLTSLL